MASVEYVLIRDIVIDGQPHPAGSPISLDPEFAQPLVDIGDIQLAGPTGGDPPPPPAPASGTHRVLRPVIIDGKPAAPGDLVRPDALDVLNLLVAAQIAEV